MTAHTAPPAVEEDDIQGLLRFGYRKLTQASFLLMRVQDAASARAWLTACPVGSAREQSPPPRTVLQVAISCPGLRALGVREDVVQGFSREFIAGMSSDDSRARRLGDLGPNAPRQWQWGGRPDAVPHVLLMLYALPGELQAWQEQVLQECEAGFSLMSRLDTSDMDGVEPFGFVDGISQPGLDWKRKRAVRDEQVLDYSNLSCLGEYLLGYPNEYGEYTDRPLLQASRDPQGLLPRAEENAQLADLGRNGSYLVLRQLRQDVGGFWRFADAAAGGDPVRREQLASAMVGRSRDGLPLVDDGGTAIEGESDPINSFTYDEDPLGQQCPIGAHIRRSNPRNADLPPGGRGPLSRLIRTLGFDAQALARDHVSSTRFHRLLRRGREYGDGLTMEQALAGEPGSAQGTGLHFICLGASIARQFEFVQGAWIAGTHFGDLHDESDPLLGTRLPGPDGMRTDGFSIPADSGCDVHLSGLPQFVQVLGGAYFFLPGIRALRFIAKEP
ncbi:MAG: peroxidase [Proteobacteria bacterium]|nr:peroxidase [Pseudomonadota bacterium]